MNLLKWAICLIMLAAFAKMCSMESDSRNGPRADAVVESTEVVRELGSKNSSPPAKYHVYAHYVYEVGGREYRARYLVAITARESRANQEAAQFPAGRPITIGYNPKKPAYSVIVVPEIPRFHAVL
ncbi:MULTISPECIES: DUF3592 domain-containing protein [Pseudomonas]|uniref:DUF3592 domain-containing protein n=1 Tax=Pseudomonas nitroreducens TaxID=46680 RepID=A0A6G6IWY9_PSENT|nr:MULTISPECIES: DUF3592 domain-containing protein [Pseudomonas]MBG6291546.1 DUF3592 domain-containing protein [Pseudomonas nitroreducens]MCJ1877992.1 DUF3592 domain-containing protein [Pseudomonas nitroreducens]MCJ1894389.1 DUF3592 domain-containing protein [Pseudomonas nitroreducens]MDG9858101.1 DUF3592 domain-containing protein [Pseudomonas nitroreducens]MDH1074196.1 DUF3592 domain-containing protein [Pseudomonas nitroreducens]